MAPCRLGAHPPAGLAITGSYRLSISPLFRAPVIEANVASIIKKIDAMPLEAIGVDLKNAIVELDRTLVSARKTLDTADQLIAPNSLLATELDRTLSEAQRAAQSLRVLADDLEQHPETLLLRGKTEAK